MNRFTKTNSINKRGFIPLIIIAVAAFTIVAIGGFLILREKSTPTTQEISMPTPSFQEQQSRQEPAGDDIEVEFETSGTEVLFKGGYADPSVIQKRNGTYLMYLNQQGNFTGNRTGTFVLRSSDGASWNKETDTLFEGVATLRAFVFPDGVRVYYPRPVRAPRYPFESIPRGIVSQFSVDGISGWKDEGFLIKPSENYSFGGPGIIQLKDGTYRLFYDRLENGAEGGGTGKILESEIWAATSDNETSWVLDNEPAIVFENNIEGKGGDSVAQVLHPFVIEWPERDGYVMIYNSHSRLFAAFSKDGFSWQKLGFTGIRGADADGFWVEDGRLKIFYGDFNSETGGLVYAALLNFPPSFTSPSPMPVSTPSLPPSPVPTISPTPSLAPPQEKKFQVLSVTKDSGSRVSGGSVPFIMKLDDGHLRLYYCGQGGIISAISLDGLSFLQESGVRIGPNFSNEFEKIVCDPTLVKLPDGRARMYYKGADTGQGGPGQAIHKIFSAISSDGLNFQKEGLRVDSEKSGDNGWASVPDAIMLSDGRVRLYFVTGDFSSGGLMTMTAADGLNFGERKALNLKSVVDPAIVLLKDGTFILLAAVIDERFPPYRPKGLYLFTSKDGFSFENETQLIEESGVFDPSGVLLDGDTLRVYYGYGLPPAPPETRSITVKFNY